MNRARNDFNATTQDALAKDLHKALNALDLETLKVLVEMGADVDGRDTYSNTLLIIASIHGDTALARMAVEKGADIEKTNNTGSTALMLAAANNRPDIVRLLIKAGADLDRSRMPYGTALDWARRNSDDYDNTEVIEMLEAAAKRHAGRHERLAAKRRAYQEIGRRRRPEIKDGPS
jgi:ankyrin repeat protein